jgi:hypothetical protein
VEKEHRGRGDGEAERSGAPWRLVSSAAFATALLSAVTMRRAIEISHDGWVYWQGSVSMLEGLGYHDFYDLPIDLWPPLYSIYLAGWQALLGVSGGSLVVANVAAATGATVAWALAFDRFARGLAPDVRRVRRLWPVLALVVALAVRNSTLLLSEAIYIGLFPLALIAADAARSAEDRRRYVRACAGLCLALALCLLGRNSALAVLLPTVALAALNGAVPMAWRLMGPALCAATSVSAWLACRTWLDQVGMQPVGFGLGRYGLLEYVAQTAAAVDALLLPLGIAGALLALALALPFSPWAPASSGAFLRGPAPMAAARRWSLVCFGSVGGLIAIFLMTYVADPLGARHMLVIALLGAGCVLVVASSISRPAARLGLATLILAFPIGNTLHQAFVGIGPTKPTRDGRVAAVFVPHDLLILPSGGTGGRMIRGDGIRFTPPLDRREGFAHRQHARDARARSER